MRNILRGLKNKINIAVFIIVTIQLFLASINFANAEKLDSSKVCEKYGGTYTAAGCLINETGVGGSQTLRLDSSEIDLFYVLNNNNFSCPSGYNATKEPSYTMCAKAGGPTDTKNQKIQAKNTVESVIESLRNRDEYNKAGQSLNDDDWKAIKEQCKGKIGQEATTCVTDAANKKAKEKTEALAQEGNNSKEGETSCAIDNVGWIICPTTNFMASVVQNAYKWIAEEFLTIKSNLLFQSNNNTFRYWTNFRDIANILFVILFIVIIFSQITNMGISNYGLKKMLPRLLVFAVLINVSYWVSVIFVDISNILGREIFNTLSSEEMKGVTDLEQNTALVLATTGGVALAYAGGIFLSLVAAIIAILVVLATLIIRQAAVVILIVISPIAFASAILPGTESLFSKWKSTLKAMLIIYPVSSLLVGGMLTASNILVGTTEGSDGIGGYGMRVIYTLIPIAGLVSIFAVIKGALAAIDKLTGGSITGKLNSMASGLNKAAEKSPIGSLDKGINSRIAAKYQQFGGKLSRRANRFAKAGEESRARALRDAQISDYEKMGSLNSGQELHLSKLRSDRQKEADLLTSSRSLALSNEIGSKSGEYIAKAEAALNRQDGEELGVILDSIMTNPRLSGKDRMAKISEIISKMSAEQASSGAVQKAMATFAGKHGGNIKKDDPALLKTIGSLADGTKKSGAEIYQEHASNVETYKDASQSDAAGWNPQALANIEKYKSGWSAHDAEVVGAKSAAVLGDERLRHSISEAQRELHQKIATDAGLKISHDDNTNSTQADIAQALKDLNSTIQQQNQQPTQQRQAPQPRGPRRWR